MNRALIWGVAAVAALGTAGALLNAKARTSIRKGVYLGSVYVGGMTPSRAQIALRGWWKTQELRQFRLVSDRLGAGVTTNSKSLEARVDFAQTVAKAPRASLLDVFRTPRVLRVRPVLIISKARADALATNLSIRGATPSKAKVFYSRGKIVRLPERGGATLDKAQFRSLLVSACWSARTVRIPFIESRTRVSPNDLAGIKVVVSEYSTRFSTSKKSRCSNIRLASSKLNGIVLLPGDRLSFNQVVGRRTEKNGFQIAGVFKNGKHDTDVGGGICQVSTTLYNAALLANLRIVHRHNHSLPVAYVPAGRDATVDYGSLDLEIENTCPSPIALCSEYKPGKLTFRVLGAKQDGIKVMIVSEGRKVWDPGVELVSDPTLEPGQRKLLDKGSRGQSIRTYRLVYKDGELIRKESLGESFYKGGPKVIAVKSGASTSTEAPGPLRLVSTDSH